MENIEASEVSQTQKEMHCVLLKVDAYTIKKIPMSERGSTKDGGGEERADRAEGDGHA